MHKLFLSGNSSWVFEGVFSLIRGIESVDTGKYTITSYPYALGDTPTLDCTVITFNEENISIESILKVFLASHSASLNKWDDEDCFYPLCRSAIFCENETIQKIIQHQLDQVNANILNPLEKFDTKIDIYKESFFKSSHTSEKNFFYRIPNDPYIRNIVQPKMVKIKQLFPELMKGNNE
jgi:peptide methionine sulfoxide reductase MsrA